MGIEVYCYPPGLMTTTPADVPGRLWYVARTMARQEKKLARELYQLKIPFYLPMLPRKNRRGHPTMFGRPLLSGFLFAYCDHEERRACLATGRVASMLVAGDQAKLQQDLQRIESSLKEGLEWFPADDSMFIGCTNPKKHETNPSSNTLQEILDSMGRD